MKFIGLLMVAFEDDILEEVLAGHEQLVDAFYALDGTIPNERSRSICQASEKCAGYFTDSEIAEPYPSRPVDGWRGFLYEQAAREFQHDNWFLLLHGDEVWTFDPQQVAADAPEADGFVFQLPLYFPRAGEEWRDGVSALEQVRWHLGPGYPEFRMFRGAQHVSYRPDQHFNVTPDGLRAIVPRPETIKHYPYRSPEVQLQRAFFHLETGFEPSNYRHVLEDKRVYWDDEFIARYQRQRIWRDLAKDPA